MTRFRPEAPLPMMRPMSLDETTTELRPLSSYERDAIVTLVSLAGCFWLLLVVADNIYFFVILVVVCCIVLRENNLKIKFF